MIGVFDSGLGGLTTLKELQKVCPEYAYCYLGDTANAPYGKRSTETIKKLTEQGVEFLFAKGAKIVLIACNTASSDALRFLQKKYKNIPEKKVLGVLIPAAQQALEHSRYGVIGVVGTQHTIDSGNFEKEIAKNADQFFSPTEKDARNKKRFQKIPKVFSASCPLLVPLIEEGWVKKPETTSIVKKYITPLKSCNIDTLILGCTHYPIIEKIFQKKMGKNCRVINSGKAQAEKFLDYLQSHPEIETAITQKSAENTTQFFTTDCPEKFRTLGQKFLGIPLPHVQKVEM
jgi:glutamate racemase